MKAPYPLVPPVVLLASSVYVTGVVPLSTTDVGCNAGAPDWTNSKMELPAAGLAGQVIVQDVPDPPATWPRLLTCPRPIEPPPLDPAADGVIVMPVDALPDGEPAGTVAVKMAATPA